jgi:hypothetical protein
MTSFGYNLLGFGSNVAPPDRLVLNLDAGNSSSYSGSGTTWTDLSGNGHNATLINGPTYTSDDGGSLIFDGSNDYATISNASALGGFSGDFSIEFWFKGGDQGNYSVFLENYGAGTQEWAIQAAANGASGNMIWVRNGGIIFTTSGIDAFDDNWHQHVVSRVGATITYYIDTSSRGSETFSTNLNSGNTLGISRYSGTSYHINGSLPIIRIYNGKGLTQGEVSTNFDAVKARYGL